MDYRTRVTDTSVWERKKGKYPCDVIGSHVSFWRVTCICTNENTVILWCFISPHWSWADKFCSHAAKPTQVTGHIALCRRWVEHGDGSSEVGTACKGDLVMDCVGCQGRVGQIESSVADQLRLAPRFQWPMLPQFGHAFTLDYQVKGNLNKDKWRLTGCLCKLHMPGQVCW